MQLPNDTALRKPEFTVISASAGSGKTHTLTLRLLQLLLSTRIPLNRLRNILAITFTNNAAGEMRDRVLEYLKRGALGEDRTLRELGEVVAADAETLKARCAVLIDTILAEYSGFQIQTIDSFLTRVFRASALEIGLPPGADVVLDNRAMLDRAFEDFARAVAEDPAQHDLLVRLTRLFLESRRAASRYVWDPFNLLSREVRRLYETLSAQPSEIVSHEARIADLLTAEEEIRTVCANLARLAAASGLEASANFLGAVQKAQSSPVDDLLSSKSLFNPPLKRSGPNARDLNAVTEWNARCAQLQERIRSLLRAYVLLRSRTQFEPFLQAYRLFRTSIDAVSRRAGQISLSELNRALVRSMESSVVPQIYLYLGDTIYHYLIDEFQDTAPVQWQALRPLVEEALAKEGSLFVVGDTKQSIYGFRHADWRIMKRLWDGEEFPSVTPTQLTLDMNYRSGEHLVTFVRTLFHERIPAIVDPSVVAASGLSTAVQSVPAGRTGKGFVEVKRFDGGEVALARGHVIGVVQDCLRRGHRFGDITVLTPKNEHVVEVSGWLNAEEIPFVSHSSLDIRNRPVIGDLLALLRYLASPVDDLSFAAFILGGTFRRIVESNVLDLRPEDIRAFLLEQAARPTSGPPLYVRFREAYPKTWDAWFERLLQVTGYLPMYDLVCEIIRRYQLFELWPKEAAALTRFLEALVGFENIGANDLGEFLSSAEREEDEGIWSLDVPRGLDAVDVMTVHKAKGLDNRVVIVLLVDGPPRPENEFFAHTEEGVELLYIRKAWTEVDPGLKKVYDTAQFDRQVDELNKLYVALTRAKDEMYVLSVAAVRTPAVSRFFSQDEVIGERPAVRREDEPEPAPAEVFHPPAVSAEAQPRPEKLGIAERRRGEALHAVLAKIVAVEGETEAHVRRCFSEVSEKYPDVDVTPELVRKISAFLELPSVRPFFEPGEGRSVLAEQEFVEPGGELRRMDRVVVDADRVTVIDYKTGGDNPEYHEQVRHYMSILRGVYPGRQVQGMLAFIDRQHTQEVV